MVLLKASIVDQLANLDTGSGSARRKLGYRIDRLVPASMSAIV